MLHARFDPTLEARVIARRPLRYRNGADPSLDRPAHVRAASSIVWLGAQLVVIQDDASFLGIVDPATGLVDDAPLPAGPGGRRVYDAQIGNKADKPDLEAGYVDADGRLVAVASGGPLAARQVIATWAPPAAPELHAAAAWYAAIAAAVLPAGTALNLEGATRVDGALWLVNRGGDRSGEQVSPDALVRFDGEAIHAVIGCALGALDGAALRFTDLAVLGARLAYLATAEATTSYFDDGDVRGSVLGVIDRDPAGTPIGLRHVAVVDARGVVTLDKLEGVAAVPGDAARAYAVVDFDDPARPADLLELAIVLG